ncbi:MAG: glycosyltransferase family 9 protein [Pseudomonadota bacterium]
MIYECNTTTYRSILVVRPGALGDTILAFTLTRTLHGLHPDARITFLGTGRYREIAPQYIDYRSVDHRDWTPLFAASAEGAFSPPVSRFDTAFVVMNRPENVMERLNDLVDGEVRCGPSTPTGGRHVVKFMHEGLGLPLPEKAAVLDHLSTPDRAPLIWLHPGSGGAKKCLPLNITASLADSLKRETGWALGISLGEEDAFLTDHPHWERLARLCDGPMVRGESLSSLCRVMGNAGLYVGNDSGISHLAAGMGIPAIVCFRTTDPVVWSPWVPDASVRVVDCRGEGIGGVVRGVLFACAQLTLK